MARRPKRRPKLKINDLLAPYSKRFQEAFEQALQRIRDDAEFNKIVAALKAGNIDAAVAALHIDAGVFSEVDLIAMQTFQAGGTRGATMFTEAARAASGGGAAFVVHFNPRSPRAEQWASQYTGDLIQGITQDQLTMVRNHMREGLAAGRGPAQTALDVVGRIDKRSGRRKGGALGLTDHQASIVRESRNQLARGNAEDLRKYLGRELRDKRYDPSVLKAIRDGKPLPAELQGRMNRAYENNMLRFRGETIARTETMKSLHQAQQLALQQGIEENNVQPSQVRRIWRTASDARVRDSHQQMEAQSVGLEEHFTTGAGASLMFPGDPNGPANEIINCRCDVEIRIDFLANVGRNDGN